MDRLNNETLADVVYSVVLVPLRTVAKELRYFGFTETMVKDFIGLAVSRGLEDYEEELRKSNAGH